MRIDPEKLARHLIVAHHFTLNEVGDLAGGLLPVERLEHWVRVHTSTHDHRHDLERGA